MTLTLRPYQREAAAAVRAGWEAGDLAGLCVLPTGAGKTVLAVGLVRDCGTPRTMFLVHRDRLVRQAVAAFRKWLPGVSVGVVKAKRREYDAQVVIASVQSLHAGRLPDLDAYQWDVVIVDEAHHAELRLKKTRDAAGELTGEVEVTGNGYGRLLTYLRRLNPALRVVGLTATPARSDRRGLGGCFPGRFRADGLPLRTRRQGVEFYHRDIEWGIAEGHLCGLRALRVDTRADLEDVPVLGGDFETGALSAAVNVPERNRMIVEAWKEHAAGRPTVAFCVDVGADPSGKAPRIDSPALWPAGHVFAIAQAFRQAGVKAAPVWGAMLPVDREQVETEFEAGRLDVVCNCDVWTEGVDFPAIACVTLAAPTKSSPRLQQRIGRGLRPGKPDCLVLDCVDTARTGLLTMADLRIPSAVDALTGASLVGLICLRRGCQALKVPEHAPFCSERCRCSPPSRRELPKDEAGVIDWTAHEFCLFAGPISWGQVGQSRVLGLGDGRVVFVFPRPDGWRAALCGKRSAHWLTEPTTEPMAIQSAEAMLRKSGTQAKWLSRYGNRFSWWDPRSRRDRGATQGQRRMAAGYGVAVRTALEASLALDWCSARLAVAREEGEAMRWRDVGALFERAKRARVVVRVASIPAPAVSSAPKQQELW